MKEARERPLEYVLELTREYGEVCQVRLGPTRLVIVNSPELVKQVLQERHAHYARPAFVALLRRIVGNGLLFSEGDFWLRQRRTIQPMFHRPTKQLEDTPTPRWSSRDRHAIAPANQVSAIAEIRKLPNRRSKNALISIRRAPAASPRS